MIKKHVNMTGVLKNATTKCHGDHIILRFYWTTERLVCEETEGS